MRMFLVKRLNRSVLKMKNNQEDWVGKSYLNCKTNDKEYGWMYKER